MVKNTKGIVRKIDNVGRLVIPIELYRHAGFVGCDIGSEMHFIRAIDNRGIEISKVPLGFTNDKVGFEKAKQWMLELAAQYGKKQIVLGLDRIGR